MAPFVGVAEWLALLVLFVLGRLAVVPDFVATGGLAGTVERLGRAVSAPLVTGASSCSAALGMASVAALAQLNATATMECRRVRRRECVSLRFVGVIRSFQFFVGEREMRVGVSGGSGHCQILCRTDDHWALPAEGVILFHGVYFLAGLFAACF